MPLNSRTFWYVRAMPWAAMSCAARCWISTPSKRMVPESDGSRPLIRLTSVVLPAPLGPIRPATLPVGTVIEKSETAATPPKCLSTVSTSSKGGDPPGELHGAPPTALPAAGPGAPSVATFASRRRRSARGSTRPRGRKIMISSSTTPLATSWISGTIAWVITGSAVKTAAPMIAPTQWKDPPSTIEAIMVKADVDEIGVGRKELQRHGQQHRRRDRRPRREITKAMNWMLRRRDAQRWTRRPGPRAPPCGEPVPGHDSR